MKHLFLLILLIANVAQAQMDMLWLNDAKSVELVVYHNQTKEVITEDEVEVINELGRCTLNTKHDKKFKKIFDREKNYGERSALLTHFNIEFILHGFRTEFFHISSITRTVYHYQSDPKLDFGYTRRIGPKLEKWIIKILKYYELYDLIDEEIRFQPNE